MSFDDAESACPQVSILTPFWNASAFFEETIESALAQTYESWELLLIDDGSMDGSTATALEYARRCPHRIRYLAHPARQNRGTSAALNLGIRHARGEFLALLDADDVWLPNKLSEQVPLLQRHPTAGMLYSNSLFWYSWTGEDADLTRDFSPPLGVPLDQLSQPPEILTLCLQRKAAVPCPCSVLLRADVVRRVGGFEEAFRVTFSDQAFYTKMFTAAPVYVAGRIWDKYRIHSASAIATAKRSGGMRAERRRYLAFVARYLENHGLAHGPLWRALRAERRRMSSRSIDALLREGRLATQFARRALGAVIPRRWRSRHP